MTYYAKNKDRCKAYNREVYYWRKENGICTRCGKNKAVEGRVYCKSCAEDNRQRAIEYRRRLKNDKG